MDPSRVVPGRAAGAGKRWGMQLSSPRLRAALLAAASLTLVAAVLPPPKPLGIGDTLFPELGNPGYDVLTYDLSFTYKDNKSPLDAITVIDARALEALERINLDFSHGTVASARVNGEPAQFESAGEDLVLTPARPVAANVPLHIEIRHTSDPRGIADGGWLPTEDGLAMANQADAAHRVFPCNDHPADKAYFTFRITAPAGLTAVANGVAGALPTPGPRARPPGRTGPCTPWPPSSRRSPSATRPWWRPPGRTGCRCAAWSRPRTARGWSPGCRRPPGTCSGWSSASAATPSRTTGC